MDKSAKYALPAFSFSNVLISDAAKHGSVAFTTVAYNAKQEGPYKLVPLHELSAELLLRMWREDCAPALAFMDQPTVLRQAFGAFGKDAVVAACTRWTRADRYRTVDRTWLAAGATATGNSANSQFTTAELASRVISR